MSDFDVSIVIPAFNEGEKLPRFASEIVRVGLDVPTPAVEFVVVDDGSAQAHLEKELSAVEEAALRFSTAGSPHAIRLIRAASNSGKGSAIRRGWIEAASTAAWLGFLDADGAVPAREVWRLISLLDPARFDMIAATRIRMAGHHIDRSLFRHLQGRVFATLTEHWISNGFYDTQCGYKLAQASRVRPLLPLLREERWLLDIELIALLLMHGSRCVEEPIDWSDAGGSKVVPLLDPLRMVAGLRRLRRRLDRLKDES